MTRRRRVQTGEGSTAEAAREFTSRPDDDVEAREGDTITVVCASVKVQVAPYSTVESDSFTMTRHLVAGESAAEQFDRVHSFLERRAVRAANAKIRAWSEQLAAARKGE